MGRSIASLKQNPAVGSPSTERPHHGWAAFIGWTFFFADGGYPDYTVSETLWNPANCITLIRLLVCSCILSVAALTRQDGYLYLALGLQWVLDFLDGGVARWRRCETRFGACLDAQSDRVVLCLALLVAWQTLPEAQLAIVLYLLYLVLLDGAMFVQAMQTGIRSTNYYYLVDRRAWQLCWSPGAKFATAVILPTLILTDDPWHSAIVVVALAIVVRVPIMKRVLVDFYRELGI